jgi:acyl carrier protein
MLSLEARLEKIFAEILEIKGPVEREKLKYNAYPAWNSLGHMALVAAIETEFDCMLETDEILGMSSFDAALHLANKYARA